MKNILLIFLFIFGSGYFLTAQNDATDYIVTLNRDTIYGKTKRIVSIFKENGVKIEPDIFYKFEDIFCFTFKNNFYYVIKEKMKNGDYIFFSLCMIIDGKQKLAGEFCELSEANYMMHNGFFTYLNHKSFRLEIWPEMLECEEFAKLHASFSNKYLKKLIVNKRWNELILIVKKYNDLCS